MLPSSSSLSRQTIDSCQVLTLCISIPCIAQLQLNALIFALGGLVWGTVVSNSDPTRLVKFEGRDWGYMILTYILMMLVRGLLMVAFYPVISRIGLKWNLPEMIFTIAGGLRGAVGIALAISLDNELRRDTVPGDPRRDFTTQIYGIIGGKQAPHLSSSNRQMCFIRHNSFVHA